MMSSSAPDPNLAMKLTESLNGLYAGNYLAGVFYGLTTHQTFIYFRKSGNDSLSIRLLVLLLWILDTLHAVLLAVALRALTGEYIVNPSSLSTDKVPWTLTLSLFLMCLSDTGVRAFYCYRIWRLSQHNWLLTTIPVLPVICALVAGLYSTSKTMIGPDIQAFNLIPELEATLISICIADSILAGLLCMLLWRSRSGIRRTDSIISTLILYTITTGLLTTVVAIFTVVIMLTLKGTYADVGSFYMLSKLYFSSFLATLSRREKIRTQMEGPSEIVSLPLQTGNSRGSRGIGGGIVFRSFKSNDDASTARFGMSMQKTNSEAQFGGHHQGRVEIKVETQMIQDHGTSGKTLYMNPKEDENSHSAYQNQRFDLTSSVKTMSNVQH